MTPADEEDAAERTIAIRPTMSFRAAAQILHFLVYAEGDERQRIAIGPAGLVIGRAPPADLVIPRPEISRRHCSWWRVWRCWGRFPTWFLSAGRSAWATSNCHNL